MGTQHSGAFAAVMTAATLLAAARAVPLANEGNQTLPVVTQEPSGSGGLSTTAVVVIVVGVVVVLALLGWLYCLTCKKNKMKKNATIEDGYTSVQTPQQQLEKSHEFHDEFGTHHVDIVPGNGPKINAPRSTKAGNGRPSGLPRPNRPAGEPALYNRELSSKGNSDSTRSYLHDLATPAENVTDRNPKIFASMNSVDFMYPDTDRSIAFSVTSDNYGHGDSSRSNDITDSYGFMIDSNRSSGVYVDDEGETVPSLRPVDREGNKPNEFDVDTAELTTQQRHQIQVEI